VVHLNKFVGVFALLGLLILFSGSADAEDFTVIVTQSDDSTSWFFEPSVLEVEVGDNVTFVWGNGSHNVAQVSDSESKVYTSGFYSGNPQVGGNWSLPAEFTAQDGTLYYVCEPHVMMNMRGSIIVGSGLLPLTEISMEFSDFPWLSYLLVFPIIGAIWSISFSNTPNAPRMIALFTTLFTLIISLIVFVKTGSKSGYSLMEEYEWAPDLGVSLLLGVDGLSSPLILLTGIIGPLTVIFAWEEKERAGLFFSLLLVMQTALYGVFATLDYFVFYIFWEIVLIPMFFLIAIWGGENRRYASIKFFIYTFTASVIMLVGFMALYFESGANSFSMIDIANSSRELSAGNEAFSEDFQIWIFAALFIGFAVKIPSFPWHTWLPDAHVQAPTAGSILLAGVMLKMGLYGLIRAALPPLPLGAVYFVPVMVALAIISIIYGAALSLGQTDLKKLVAYSSVSHMGVALLGVATMTELGLAGAVFMMFAHGILSPAMFMIAGVLFHQVGTREIPKLGGLAKHQPKTAGIFVVIFMGSLGLPGMAVFVAELAVFIAFFQSHGYWLLLPIFGMVLTAGYHLWALQRAIFGTDSEEIEMGKVHEAPWYELYPMFTLIIIAAIFGIFPHYLMDPINTACYDILRFMGVI
jgi:proton-translocating NADH-quinone oxidoreductase chain M